MSELLTAKDVEVKIFKKASFGGYVIAEVEDFLNQVADDLETYSLRLLELLHRNQELEEALEKYEGMKDMIKDALILAQKSAKDKEEEARLQAEKTLEFARTQASSIVAEAEGRIADIDSEVQSCMDEAHKKAEQIVNEAKATAAQILQNAEAERQEVKRRADALEQKIALRMEKASDEALGVAAVARAEARDLIKRTEEDIAANRHELETLRLGKQKFLKDALTLVFNFGQMLHDAQKRDRAEEQGQTKDPHSSELLGESSKIAEEQYQAKDPHSSELLGESSKSAEEQYQTKDPHSSELLDESSKPAEEQYQTKDPHSSELLGESSKSAEERAQIKEPNSAESSPPPLFEMASEEDLQKDLPPQHLFTSLNEEGVQAGS